MNKVDQENDEIDKLHFNDHKSLQHSDRLRTKIINTVSS